MWWILMNEVNNIHKVNKINTLWTGSTDNNEKQIQLVKLYEESEKYIDKWLELNSKSPMLNLVKWKLEMNKWDNKKSFLYLTKTVSLDQDWEFGEMAKLELKNIETVKKE
jgi:hypothetical protein